MSTSASFAELVSARSRSWQLRQRSIDFGPLPRLMGILNVTPDSFSDGGKFLDARQAIDHGLRLEDEGADLLDIGGESTRPYADPVSTEDELRRIMPVVEGLVGRAAIPLSIDTSKPAVARAALEAGAEIVNDVTALSDPQMRQVVRELQPGLCAMHMRGTPQTMQNEPTYADVVREIGEYLQQRRDQLTADGVAVARVCLDPGIGFGKTTSHNLELLQNCWRFHALGCPLLVGFSRKGLIGKVLGDPDADRLAGGLGVASSLARQGVQILRVHEVAPYRQTLALYAASGGMDH
jgi:dihydropteroate synthase